MSLDPTALYTDEYRRRPEPVWRQLRHDHPLFHDTIGDIWWLSRYDDVAAVFADHVTYSAATYEATTGQVIGPTLISRDDHGHVARRSIVAPDFVGKRLAAHRPLIVACATALLDRFDDSGPVDLVGRFSARLPVDVIAAILGMSGDGDRFRQWVTDMIRGLSGAPELRARGLDARAAFCAHIAPALVDVDDPARTDHIARIARAEVDGARLDDEEITAFCGLLFIAGGETTDKAIANMWWNLLTRRHLFDAVVDDPALWDNAFSETMRRTAPVISEDRFTTRPVAWHGVEIPVGARVRVCMGAAHLDETRFANPEVFDLDRRDLHLAKELRSGGSTDPDRHGHLGFGLGKHFCIGYELARTEAIIGSRLLVDRYGSITIEPGSDPRPVIQGNAFQAVEQLLLRLRGRVTP